MNEIIMTEAQKKADDVINGLHSGVVDYDLIREALERYFEPTESQQLEVQVQRMYRFESDRPLKAFADIIVNDSLLIKGVKVLQGKNGLYCSMPAEQCKDKKWYDSVRCLTNECRKQITEKILDAYNDNNKPCDCGKCSSCIGDE